MAADIVQCDHCGQKNRVPAAASGSPRCGRCHRPLPWIVDVDDNTFAEVAEAASIPVLVDFWAPWCGPCRMVTPVLEQLARELAGQFKLVKVNVDTAPRVGARFTVQAVPTLLVMSRGQVTIRQAGAPTGGALRDWVKRAITAAAATPTTPTEAVADIGP